MINELNTQVSELRQQNQQLQRELDSYQKLYELAPLAYVILDHNTQIVRANAGFAEMVGCPNNQLESRRFGDFVQETDLVFFEDFMKTVAASLGAKEVCTVTVIDQDDQELHAHIDGRYSSEDNLFYLALTSDSMQSELEDLAVLRERQQLAREIHDSVMQMAFSASIYAETLSMSKNNDQIGQHLGTLVRLTKGIASELRNLLLDLRSPKANDIDLAVQLNHLATGVLGRIDADVEVNIGCSERIPYSVQLAFYRIARLALDNVVQHAHATKLIMSFECDHQHALIKIQDDGQGFDVQAAQQKPGIKAMREYADKIGAEFNIITDTHTTVLVEWKPEI